MGDGSYLINGKNPDFINEKSKKVIEFFGELWHKPEDEQIRTNFFKSCGWDCFVIWGKDMTSKRNRTKLLEQILRWNNNH